MRRYRHSTLNNIVYIGMKMLTKKDKKRLKKVRYNVGYISIKSNILATLHATAISFFIVLLFQSVNNNPIYIDIIFSFLASLLVYLFISIYLFGSILLCLKLSLSYFCSLYKKYFRTSIH